MSDTTSEVPGLPWDAPDLHAGARAAPVAAVVLWCLAEPQRVGELMIPPPEGKSSCLGRLEPDPEHLGLWRQVGGELLATGAPRSTRISREQLRIQRERPQRLRIERIGRRALLVNGRESDEAELEAGDVFEIADELTFLVAHRPRLLEIQRAVPAQPFGRADEHGLVGESPAMWELRGRIRQVARRRGHVLIHGPSGTGKEAVARAIHGLGDSARPLVARNAATIPETLVDAELFGNLRGFPNSNSPERIGLVGEADGSSLFLDEIGELPERLQVHFLRLLDGGEYQRLGDSRARQASFRCIGATNRPLTALKSDFLARFALRIEMPGLEERAEDIPLIACHLLRRMADEDPSVAERFFAGAHPRLDPALVRGLVQRRYSTHVRELERALWEAVDRSRGNFLAAPPGPEPVALPAVASPDLSPERIQSVLDRHEGIQARAWKELGLPSRHSLGRLVRRYGLRTRGRPRSP